MCSVSSTMSYPSNGWGGMLGNQDEMVKNKNFVWEYKVI